MANAIETLQVDTTPRHTPTFTHLYQTLGDFINMGSFNASNKDSHLNHVKELLSEYHFDMQGLPPLSRFSSVIDEATLAKVLTKLAVGSATVWWSLLEIREMVSLYKRSRKKRS